MTCSSGVPGSVEKSDFTWRWYFIEIDDYEFPGGVVIGDSGPHNYYVVLDEPQEPMEEPWIAVLDYACVWADGKSDADDAAIEIGKHIYEDFGLEYDSYYANPHYQGEYQGVIQFELTDFLNDVPGSSILVDCEDCAEALTTFANALGCGMSCEQAATFGQVNCINLIGLGWTNNPRYLNPSYCSDKIYDEYSTGNRSGFSNHVLGVLDSKIYDCMIRVDTDAEPDAEPHSPSDGTWALGNWTWSQYKDAVVHSGSPAETLSVRNFDVR